jgi:hypothetical protein
MIKRTLIIIATILLTSIYSFGQNITNSPYTIFGIGEIDRNGFNNSKAMGGLATGLRKSNQINYMNPAAMSAQDTMSFILDLGINGIFKDMKSSTESSEFNDFGFDHLAISFPIKRWWYAGIGIAPYSKIGYDIQQVGEYSANDTVQMHYDYYGNGGINQLFLSNSFKIFDHLSIGFNVNYLFGSLEQYNMVFSDISVFSTVIVDEIAIKKVTFDFGAQYYNTIQDKYFYNIGITYSNNTSFNSEKKHSIINTTYNWYDMNIVDYLNSSSRSIDTIASSIDSKFNVEIPDRYSFGFTAGIEDKLIVGFDYSYQDWSNANTINSSDVYDVDQYFNLGIEYIPNKFSLRDYYKRINYRAGAYLNNSYLKLNGEQIKNYGITFGLGFPIANQRTSINVSCSIGKKGTTDSGLIEENYTAFGINLTLYDFWFIKRKFQ